MIVKDKESNLVNMARGCSSKSNSKSQIVFMEKSESRVRVSFYKKKNLRITFRVFPSQPFLQSSQ